MSIMFTSSRLWNHLNVRIRILFRTGTIIPAKTHFRRRLTFANGKTLDREFRVGNIVWVEAQTHIGENTGETDTHVLIIELKEPPKHY